MQNVTSLQKHQLDNDIEQLLERAHSLMRDTCVKSLDRDSVLRHAIDHHFTASGSRSRARLTISSALSLDLKPSTALRLAAAVECLHNASLVQDDLQDGDGLRRGQTAVWKKYGTDMAINVTDLMIASAFALLASVTENNCLPELIARMQRAIAITLHGQSHDLNTGTDTLDVKHALSVARSKSGPLFALSIELPLIAAGVRQHLDNAHEAGCLFGMGYQILDDIKDARTDVTVDYSCNVLVALRQRLPAADARSQAYILAGHHLDESLSLAIKLPRNCGQLLAAYCRKLSDELQSEAA